MHRALSTLKPCFVRLVPCENIQCEICEAIREEGLEIDRQQMGDWKSYSCDATPVECPFTEPGMLQGANQKKAKQAPPRSVIARPAMSGRVGQGKMKERWEVYFHK